MKKKFSCVMTFLLCVVLLSSIPSWAQLHLGQYQDEAPFRTWNTFGVPSASSVGMGETHFASVSDLSASIINPARLTALPEFSLTLNTSYTTASIHKYAIVNTGVLRTDGNSAMGLYAIDFAGIAFTYNGWALGISIGLLETYERPSQNPDYLSQGEVVYLLEFQQSGLLRNYNLSLARKVGGRFSFGIGLNYVSGELVKGIVENMYYSGVTISDQKEHNFKGFYLNGGFVADVAQNIRIAAVFRTPYTKKADSKSSLRYDSPQGNTDIRIEVAAESEYKQPFVLGLGVEYWFSPGLRVASDVSYFNWSSYAVTYFDEEIKKEFRDIVKISGGLEYTTSLRLFRQDLQVPLRIGLSYDPQPVEEPNSHYLYYTFGFGLHWQKLHLDAGAMLGEEKGSGHDLNGRRFAVCLSYFL